LAGIKTLEEFIASASAPQAAAFAASCGARVAPLLFWEVSRYDRSADLDTYRETLDLLWDPHHTDEDISRARNALERLPELVNGDEAVRVAAFAYQAAVAFHAALAPGSAAGTKVKECSSVLRNYAFRLSRRCDVDLLSPEDEAQRVDIEDIAPIGESAVMPADVLAAVRGRAAARGRESLAVAVSHFQGVRGVQAPSA
jgi:hypothetical protein